MKRKVLSISRSVRVLLPVVLFLVSYVFVVEAQNETRGLDIIKNKVPKHLPIKVEILYDDGLKVLENGKIKVTNTGTRDIFYVDFIVSTDDPRFAVQYSVAWLYFGRTELRSLINVPDSDDPALQPGESIFLEFGKERVELFRKARSARQTIPEKYELIFQVLSFGDGTGFEGTGGSPFPPKPKKNPRFVNVTDSRVSFFFGAAN